MIKLVLILLSVSSFSMAADITIRCAGLSPSQCELKSNAALKALGCKTTTDVNCDFSDAAKEAYYCTVKSSNCEEPRANLVNTTTCFQGKKVRITKVDRALTLSWTMGLFKSYVKDLCKQ